jgi:hypothetical protein
MPEKTKKEPAEKICGFDEGLYPTLVMRQIPSTDRTFHFEFDYFYLTYRFMAIRKARKIGLSLFSTLHTTS